MTQDEFHKLVHFVMDTPAKPPHSLFVGGMDNWHARARLAHFLAMKGIDKTEDALELFHSVVEAEIDEENAEKINRAKSLRSPTSQPYGTRPESKR